MTHSTRWLSVFFFLSSSLVQAGVSANYAEIKTFMYQLAAQHPKTVSVFELGKSDSGDMIEGLKIGTGSVKDLVVATHHGNEYGSTEVAKAFAQSLAADPMAGQTVYVIPVLNISGFNGRHREENAKGRTFDPNRDYPGPCGTAGPFNLKSTAALAQFIAQEGIVASATLHTYAPAVMYPWGISTHDLSTMYDDEFKALVSAAVIESHYEVGNSTDLLYPADGTFEDYAFWKHGIWSILFELGNSHYPSDSDVAEMQKVNVPGLRNMLAIAPKLRAEHHDFTGKCDTMRALMLDRHDE
jgi:carboxypeptidase T